MSDLFEKTLSSFLSRPVLDFLDGIYLFFVVNAGVFSFFEISSRKPPLPFSGETGIETAPCMIVGYSLAARLKPVFAGFLFGLRGDLSTFDLL